MACSINESAHLAYQPLNTDLTEIRLLTLSPGEGDNIVACTVEHVSLLNPPDFCALSYCWGDPRINKLIIVNNVSFNATTNLEAAFRRLRSKGISRLWVDSICINQEDKFEKSQQLLLMGAIYRRAKEVIAWVGEDDIHSNTVINDLGHCGRELPHSHVFSKAAIGSLTKFLERPYWRRVWVIQELALAKRTIIHCGGRQITWSQLVNALGLLKSSETMSNPAIANANSLIQFHNDASKIKPIRFLDALVRSSKALSTDPRDKVFALLGLVYDGSLYIPIPNYRQTIKDIGFGMFLSATSITSNLDIFPLLGCGYDNKHGLPSWCPFWFGLDTATSSNSIRYLTNGWVDERKYFSKNKTILEDVWYSASSNTTLKISMDNDIFRTQGILVDQVDALLSKESVITMSSSAKWSWSGNQSPIYNFKIDFAETISRTLTRHQPWSENFRACVFSFLNCFFDYDWSRNQISVDEWYIEKYNIRRITQLDDSLYTKFWLQAIASLRIGGIKSTANIKTILLEALQFTVYQYNKEEIKDPPDAFQRVLQDGQSLMMTKKGYIGWAHPRAQPGDQIYIIGGCTVPVILRKRKEGGLVLVGDAYVHGIMGGEAIENASDDDWTELEIH